MLRKQEFNDVKEVIKVNFDNGNHGIFNSRNISGDSMSTIFKGKYFTVDICFYYSYFEIFGTTEEEFEELKQFYIELQNNE